MSDMAVFLEQFHWLRPLWLLALIPAVVLALLLWRQIQSAGHWRALIAPELLGYLVEGVDVRRRRWGVWGLLAAWSIAALALAGPTWEQRPMPVHAQQDALVIVLDLSPSMLASDVTPSRLTRARHKISDILQRVEGLTGLVAYADSAHVVTPLTDDVNTIRNLVPALHPHMMPLPGSNAEEALALAIDLLQRGGGEGGRVLLLTDGIVDSARADLYRQLDAGRVQLSVLGIGTADGAPLTDQRGSFVRDAQGNIVIPRLDEDALRQVAQYGGGRYHTLTSNDDDIEWLLSQPSSALADMRQLEREFDTWYDRGPWLVLLLLPIIVYAFRPGVLLALIFVSAMATTPQPSYAQGLDALWRNADQRGERLLREGQPERAAQTFEDPEWRGSAHYRAGNYEEAAAAFAQSDSPSAHYNRGNALARAGELEAALEAYEQALEQAPDMEDALANHELVSELLEQQQQDQQDGQNGDSEDQSDQGPQSDQSQDQNQNQDQNQDQSQDQQSDEPQSRQPNEEESRQPDEGESPEPDETENSEEDEGDPEAQDAEADDQPADSDETENETDSSTPETPEPSDSGQEQPLDETSDDKPLSDEEQQALEQWLRRVPDNPSGLLQRKFQYEAEQKQRERLRRQFNSQDNERRW